MCVSVCERCVRKTSKKHGANSRESQRVPLPLALRRSESERRILTSKGYREPQVSEREEAAGEKKRKQVRKRTTELATKWSSSEAQGSQTIGLRGLCAVARGLPLRLRRAQSNKMMPIAWSGSMCRNGIKVTPLRPRPKQYATPIAWSGSIRRNSSEVLQVAAATTKPQGNGGCNCLEWCGTEKQQVLKAIWLPGLRLKEKGWTKHMQIHLPFNPSHPTPTATQTDCHIHHQSCPSLQGLPVSGVNLMCTSSTRRTHHCRYRPDCL